MEFKEFTRWRVDSMPESTEAVIMVSSCGNFVKRLPHKIWNEKNKCYSNRKEYIYKQSSNRGKQRFDSYEKITKHGKYKHVEINGKCYSVHRIVAIAFIKNKNGLPCVNHIDGNRSNNNYKNLEWVTNIENVRHAWEYGIRNNKRMMKINDNDILEAIELRKKMSLSLIGKMFGVTGETIRIRIKQHENSIHSKE